MRKTCIELKNTIALPYSKLQGYSPSLRLRAGRNSLERDVILDSDNRPVQMTNAQYDESSRESTTPDQTISTLVKKTIKPPQQEMVFDDDEN